MIDKNNKVDSKKITVEISKDLYKKLRYICYSEGLTMRVLIGEALEKAYGRYEDSCFEEQYDEGEK